MTDKVYCEDCKYYRCPYRPQCRAVKMKTETWHRSIIEYANPQVKNANNDCADYKERKWWQLI